MTLEQKLVQVGHERLYNGHRAIVLEVKAHLGGCFVALNDGFTWGFKLVRMEDLKTNEEQKQEGESDL